MTGPYFFLGPRPYREARLRSYIVREHERGRQLGEILEDNYLHRHGSRSLVWAVLSRPETISQLEADVRRAITNARP